MYKQSLHMFNTRKITTQFRNSPSNSFTYMHEYILSKTPECLAELNITTASHVYNLMVQTTQQLLKPQLLQKSDMLPTINKGI
jgi:hypothetical protein